MRGFLLASIKRGQEGVFAAKPDQHQQVGAIQPRHEARLHRHAVRVLDAGGQAEDLHVVAADVAREVGQVGERGDHADFGRPARAASAAAMTTAAATVGR